MKKTIGLILIMFMIFGIFGFTEAKVRVKGYYKPSTGRYVAPYHRSSPNKTRIDNWSTKGNYNPYTGKKGATSPFKSLKFKY